MTHTFTQRTTSVLLSFIFPLLVLSPVVVKAQNAALTAGVFQSTPGGGNCNPNPPTPNYASCLYNDGLIPGYASTSGGGAWGYVGTNGTIKFYWIAPATPPTSIHKIVFYKDSRPMTNCTIQYWDAFSQTYLTHAVYSNFQNNVADSIMFEDPIPFTDTIMIANISGPQTNPNFREIQLWDLPGCGGAPFNTVSAAYNGSAYIPGNPVCLGSKVFLNTSANLTSGGHKYEWQGSTDGLNWTSIAGATQMGYAATILGTTYYRVVDTCVANGLFAASGSVMITASAASYQSVPYVQSFETWTTQCAQAPYSNDVPGTGWAASPEIGDSSWRSSQNTGTTATTTAGWTNFTTGAYTPLASPGAGSYSARFHSTNVPAFNPGEMFLYLNAGSVTGNKQLYFYFLNQIGGIVGGDSLNIAMSSNNGITWTKLGSFDTAGIAPLGAYSWKKRSVPIQTNDPNLIIRFQGIRNTNLAENTDIGLDSVYIAPPCSGTVAAGNITLATPTNACAGATFSLFTTGTTMGGDLIFTWQSSPNGTTFTDVPANVGTGANTPYFVTPPVYDTIYYRLKVQCGPAGTPAYTSAVVINVIQPTYAAIPYSQGFDATWSTRCNPGDIPPPSVTGGPLNWTNSPGTGNNSWRREDLGSQASWSNSLGAYPTTPAGTHSARFHSNSTPTGMTGNLDLFLDCSTSTGDKELSYYYINATGNDSLRIFYSENGGGIFTRLVAYASNGGWTQYTVLLPSNSATTVVRFQGYSESGGTDIGLDSVKIIPPCDGTPNPGVISSITPCPGINFTMSLSGATIAAGLTYQWQDSIASGTWSNIAGATNTTYTTNITTNTFYRVIITCTNSTITVVTPEKLVELASFYYCYCGSAANTGGSADIGNFTVKKIPSLAEITNNGTATPLNNNGSANKTYTDFRVSVPPIPMYLDSMYKLFVTQINSGTFGPSTVSIWLDMDHSGIFDANEKILHMNTSNTTNPQQQVSDTFHVPDTALVGITGLRIVLEQPANNNPVPCGNYTTGETEDYLVEIRYPLCDGPTYAGTAYISDTSGCVGYAITVVDTSHEHFKHNITWVWQYSPDGNSWANLAGSQGRDTMDYVVTGPTYFRMRMICYKETTFTYDTTYSNVVSIAINPPFACYCFSQADGQALDSSDIAEFRLGTFTTSVGVGPHVKNSYAFRARTDYTKAGNIELFADSTYDMLVYHILRSDFHGDAKVTLFMDFNNNLQYDVSSTYNERVYSGITTSSNFTLTSNITIPHYAISDLKTGMRLILNNNTGPNIPSDEACGTYTSGETEDYVVIFRSALDVPHIGNISQLMLYPNPTEGRFTLTFLAQKSVDEAMITVTNITGQKVMEKTYKQAGREFTREFDLSGLPRGVYLVTLKADQEKLVNKVIVK